jgi:glucosamine--fructose-6-phosphate aminotransferase (isomerizing)
MNSIDAMEIEIRYQVKELPKLKLPKQTNAEDCVIVGAGDSYIAALIAHHASNRRAICCNPMEIVHNPEITKRRHQLYIVSVSGNTKANILAAKVAKEQKNVLTTAITAKPESKLAKNCDEIIELRYRSTGALTAGTIGFTSSTLACLSLVRRVDCLDDSYRIYKQTNDEVETLINNPSEKSSYYIFLGNGILFPVAIYGTLKMNEVFGSKSLAYPIEELCHSPIFSVKGNDKIIILKNKEYCSDDIIILNEKLNKMNFSSICIDCSGSMIETLLKSIFFLQLFILKLAVKQGIKDCYFLQNKDILKLSSDFIYDT